MSNLKKQAAKIARLRSEIDDLSGKMRIITDPKKKKSIANQIADLDEKIYQLEIEEEERENAM